MPNCPLSLRMCVAAQASMLAKALSRDNHERAFEALLNPPALEEIGGLLKENVSGFFVTTLMIFGCPCGSANKFSAA